jgi:CopG family nickel-responsive transcriptional regulator
MSELVRLSFSIEKPLYKRLERLMRASRNRNRSEFLRDLIRGRLVEQAWEQNEEALGTITLIYNHHVRQLGDKLTDLQHEHHHNIMATTHVHLDHDNCAEMIMVKGHADDIRKLAEALGSQKGVLHAALSMSSTGRRLE